MKFEIVFVVFMTKYSAAARKGMRNIILYFRDTYDGDIFHMNECQKLFDNINSFSAHWLFLHHI